MPHPPGSDPTFLQRIRVLLRTDQPQCLKLMVVDLDGDVNAELVQCGPHRCLQL